jgi:protocatechuate 3,4-dioxygenase beta subunit
MNHQNRFRLHFLLAVLLACVVGRSQTKPPADDKPASISGIVRNSLTGEPLAHAHITLDSYTQQKRSKYGAISTVDGRFSITTIVPGTYQVFAERRGFGTLTSHGDIVKQLELKPGEQVKDYVLRLVPDAVISGRVLDTSGSPMENIDVEAVGGGQPYRAQTDDRGEFRIGGLQEGRYLVKAVPSPLPLVPEVRSDGTSEINYAPTYYPNSSSPNSAAPVQVRPGQETSGIEIKPVTSPVLSVTGTVSGPSKDDRAFAVELVGGPAPHSFPVNPDRTFTISRVPPGNYLVFAQGVDSKLGREMLSAPVEINLVNSDIKNIDLVLSLPFEVRGQLQIEDGAPWKEKDWDQKSLSIDLSLLGPSPRSTPDAEIDFDDGSFKVTGVYPGRYRVGMDNLPKNFYVRSIRLEGTDFPDGILDLRSNPGQGLLTVELSKDGAEISGVVRDAKGPVANMRVALVFDGPYPDLAGSTTSGADGSYTLHGVAPGKYRLLARTIGSTGESWSAETLALYSSVTEKIDVSAGDRISLDLKLLP